jgi:hypothetical protein
MSAHFTEPKNGTQITLPAEGIKQLLGCNFIFSKDQQP